MSQVPAVKAALTAILRELFPAAGVSYGPPTLYPDSMAYVGGASVTQQAPTAGGPRRSREETIEVQVIFSCYVPGTIDGLEPAQAQADLDAYAMLTALEDQLRDRATATLDGTCREAMVTEHASEPLKSVNAEQVVVGAICELTATVTCKTRI